jgi:hypothetical protein
MVGVTRGSEQIKFRKRLPPFFPERSFLPSVTATKEHKTHSHKLASAETYSTSSIHKTTKPALLHICYHETQNVTF